MLSQDTTYFLSIRATATSSGVNWGWNSVNNSIGPTWQVTRSGSYWEGKSTAYQLVASNPVPEPATMLLFGTGIAGLAGIRLRKKKSA